MTKKSNLNSNIGSLENTDSVQLRREAMLPELHAAMAEHHSRRRTVRRTLIGAVCIALLASFWWTLGDPSKPDAIASPELQKPSSSATNANLTNNGSNEIVSTSHAQRIDRIGNEEMLELMEECGLPSILSEVDGKLKVIILKDFTCRGAANSGTDDSLN